jgi:small subunit ribosomal protein S13
MSRKLKIYGITLNDDKPVLSELMKVLGINRSTADKIIQKLGLQEHSRLKDHEEKKQELLDYIKYLEENEDYVFGDAVRREQINYMKIKIDRRCYAGRCHLRGKPIGGNTRSNGVTARRNAPLKSKAKAVKAGGKK